ncbi:hypothetical protein AGLY_004264 [Aphis glycines]|uniref:Uncharacterized protein n=1 Tax=Aphis glycines TaxID=307491 RepID=A0A6G0TXJ8_APHGL|nr:hypothetical protein AGLY_004264 [Aphis glycines]
MVRHRIAEGCLASGSPLELLGEGGGLRDNIKSPESFGSFVRRRVPLSLVGLTTNPTCALDSYIQCSLKTSYNSKKIKSALVLSQDSSRHFIQILYFVITRIEEVERNTCNQSFMNIHTKYVKLITNLTYMYTHDFHVCLGSNIFQHQHSHFITAVSALPFQMNNHAEAENRRLNIEMGVCGPIIWTFINCLRRVQTHHDGHINNISLEHIAFLLNSANTFSEIISIAISVFICRSMSFCVDRVLVAVPNNKEYILYTTYLFQNG